MQFIRESLSSEPILGSRPSLFHGDCCRHRRITLIEEPTPLEIVQIEGMESRGYSFYVKREDKTASGYGGNKVRNLEYILGDVVAKDAKQLVTLGPVGSNFIAALSAHVSKINVPLTIHHFEAHRNEQIEKHLAFTKRSGANVTILPLGIPKVAGAALAASKTAESLFSKGTYFVTPGGSSVLGALGHFDAFFETRRQLFQNSLKVREYIFVGVGTCGTIAGLLAANLVAGRPFKIVGVRCVDAIYANRLHILTLANRLLHLLGSSQRLKTSDIQLVDPPNGDKGYGWQHPASPLIRREFLQAGLTLDSTYTDKVALVLRSFLLQYPQTKALFWHTFSPAAMI